MINLFGGFVIGVMQRGLSLSEAIQTYSLLTVGDGLISQIPALLISVATGLIVTRAATDTDMGSDLLGQFARQTRALKVGGACVGILAVIPGLPKIPFLVVGGLLYWAGSRGADRDAAANADVVDVDAPAAAANRDTPEELAAEMRVEPLALEIAYDLMDLVDPGRGGDLLDRVRALRRKVAMDLGVVIPPVRTRDNIELPPNSYAIKVHGVEVGRGEAPAGMVLVIGDPPVGVPGTPTSDPVFGMQATWIPAEFSSEAEMGGGTVVDRASVVTTHLAEVVRTHAGRLLARQDVKVLVDAVRASDPVVAEELASASVSLAEVQKVLQALLEEQVAVRDLVRILEVLSERARVTKDTEALTEAVRAALGPAISAAHAVDGRLPVLTLEPFIEHSLIEALRAGDGGSFLALDPDITERLALEVQGLASAAEQRGNHPVLVCAAPLRPALRRLLRSVVPGVAVLSYAELGAQLQLETMGVVNLVQHATV
jgi:flagellar biosynthesis protein FlhA